MWQMASRQKKKKKNVSPEADQKAKDDALVADTASVFTCASSTVRDFTEQCTDGQEAVESDLAFNRVAHGLWNGKPGIEALVSVLEAYATERQRHLEALREIGKHLSALASDPNLDHRHLDPPDAHYDFIRRGLFSDYTE
jgi:hypothetical protein